MLLQLFPGISHSVAGITPRETRRSAARDRLLWPLSDCSLSQVFVKINKNLECMEKLFVHYYIPAVIW